jgi:TonB family protein
MIYARLMVVSLTLACTLPVLALAQESSASKKERVYGSKEVSRKVYLISHPEAEYTEEARKNGIEGSVILHVVFRSNGEIGEVAVRKGLPNGLNEKAIEAARTIKFEPALKDGRRVAQRLTLEYVFAL